MSYTTGSVSSDFVSFSIQELPLVSNDICPKKLRLFLSEVAAALPSTALSSRLSLRSRVLTLSSIDYLFHALVQAKELALAEKLTCYIKNPEKKTTKQHILHETAQTVLQGALESCLEGHHFQAVKTLAYALDNPLQTDTYLKRLENAKACCEPLFYTPATEEPSILAIEEVTAPSEIDLIQNCLSKGKEEEALARIQTLLKEPPSDSTVLHSLTTLLNTLQNTLEKKIFFSCVERKAYMEALARVQKLPHPLKSSLLLRIVDHFLHEKAFEEASLLLQEVEPSFKKDSRLITLAEAYQILDPLKALKFLDELQEEDFYASYLKEEIKAPLKQAFRLELLSLLSQLPQEVQNHLNSHCFQQVLDALIDTPLDPGRQQALKKAFSQEIELAQQRQQAAEERKSFSSQEEDSALCPTPPLTASSSLEELQNLHSRLSSDTTALGLMQKKLLQPFLKLSPNVYEHLSSSIKKSLISTLQSQELPLPTEQKKLLASLQKAIEETQERLEAYS
ncbi:MAG: hypothetical protein FJZ63_02950 [Chlamydiae bacterium]|nr:hypothetical protein [Chlamydiota bacterium]